MRYLTTILILVVFSINTKAQSRYGANDTLLVPYIVYGGDTMTYAQLDMVSVYGQMTPEQRKESQTVVVASIIVGQVISTTSLVIGRIR